MLRHTENLRRALVSEVDPRRTLDWDDRKPRLVLDAAGVSHPGRRRMNQDQHLIADLAAARRRDETAAERHRAAEEALLAVADGMGGHAHGEVASLLAVRVLVKEVLESPTSMDDPLRELDHALRSSDEALHRAGARRADLARMGTTLTAAWWIAPMLYFAHVGDSRLYLLRGECLTLLTRDHTLAADLLAAGHECRTTSGIGHILTQAIGGGRAGIEPAEGERRLEPGDVLLLCTDGLVRGLADEEITRALRGTDCAQSAANALLTAALATDDGDNITAIVGRVQSASRRAGASVGRA